MRWTCSAQCHREQRMSSACAVAMAHALDKLDVGRSFPTYHSSCAGHAPPSGMVTPPVNIFLLMDVCRLSNLYLFWFYSFRQHASGFNRIWSICSQMRASFSSGKVQLFTRVLSISTFAPCLPSCSATILQNSHTMPAWQVLNKIWNSLMFMCAHTFLLHRIVP